MGYRLPITFFTSCKAAPVSEVMTPIFLGIAGSGRFDAASNTPIAVSFFLSCSSARAFPPVPSGWRSVT